MDLQRWTTCSTFVDGTNLCAWRWPSKRPLQATTGSTDQRKPSRQVRLFRGRTKNCATTQGVRFARSRRHCRPCHAPGPNHKANAQQKGAGSGSCTSTGEFCTSSWFFQRTRCFSLAILGMDVGELKMGATAATQKDPEAKIPSVPLFFPLRSTFSFFFFHVSFTSLQFSFFFVVSCSMFFKGGQRDTGGTMARSNRSSISNKTRNMNTLVHR